MALPEIIASEAELDDFLATPTDDLIEALVALGGDLLILGVGGKMGPSLARLARRAIDRAGSRQRVIGVSRFTDPKVAERLGAAGVETISRDLLDDGALDSLPDAPNVIFMAGRKFGSTGAEDLTWAMNADLPARVARRYRRARLVVFSTGNVYPLVPVVSGGATEDQPVGPVGEYAQSCLGRERLVTYVSRRHETPMTIIRLNYAIDLRYGILQDVAGKVWRNEPVDLTMGNVNVIWQGDANRMALRALAITASPPTVLNVTGPETVSVRQLARRFGELLGFAPSFVGEEASTALLSNAARAYQLFGYPRVSLETMVRWVAHWVKIGGPLLNKPTHFEARDGRF